MIDMGEVRRTAAILRRRWPMLDVDDAESCASEAAVQVGTADQSRLVAVAKLRAIDHYRHYMATSRRRSQPLDRIVDGVVGDGWAVDGFEDRLVDVLDALGRLGRLSVRERFVVLADAVGWSGVEIAAELGVTESRVSQVRVELRRKAAA